MLLCDCPVERLNLPVPVSDVFTFSCHVTSANDIKLRARLFFSCSDTERKTHEFQLVSLNHIDMAGSSAAQTLCPCSSAQCGCLSVDTVGVAEACARGKPFDSRCGAISSKLTYVETFDVGVDGGHLSCSAGCKSAGMCHSCFNLSHFFFWTYGASQVEFC